MRVRTRCLHAVRTLLVRCSCAVRALFVRCCASANSPANYATHPSAARHTRCLPHAWPQSTEPQPQPPPAGAHRRRAQAPRPALRPPLASKPRLGAGDVGVLLRDRRRRRQGGLGPFNFSMPGCCCCCVPPAGTSKGQAGCGGAALPCPAGLFPVRGRRRVGISPEMEGGGSRASWGHSISPCQAPAAACRRRAPAKGRRAARGQRCRLWLKRWPSGSLWWCRSVTYQRSPRTGGCATIWLAPSQPAASGSHQAGQRGAGRHLSATWLLSAGIVRHSTTGLACVNRRSTEPTPGSVITVLPPHGAPLLLLAEGRGQRKGGRHRGTARRAAGDANRAPHEVEAGCLFD